MKLFVFLVFTVTAGISSIYSTLFPQTKDVPPPAQISWQVMATRIPYTAVEFGGLQWNRAYVDTRLRIENKGVAAIRDMDFIVALDTKLAGARQLTDVPSVIVTPQPNMFFDGLRGRWRPIPGFPLSGWFDDKKGNHFPIDPSKRRLGIIPSFRVHCQLLSIGEVLTVLLASVSPENGKGKVDAIWIPDLNLWATFKVPTRYSLLGAYDAVSESGVKHYPILIDRRIDP